MPDFFRDKPMDIKLYPPTTDDAKQKIQTFFQVQGHFENRISELLDIAKGEKNNGVEKIGALGYCWGEDGGIFCFMVLIANPLIPIPWLQVAR